MRRQVSAREGTGYGAPAGLHGGLMSPVARLEDDKENLGAPRISGNGKRNGQLQSAGGARRPALGRVDNNPGGAAMDSGTASKPGGAAKASGRETPTPAGAALQVGKAAAVPGCQFHWPL